MQCPECSGIEKHNINCGNILLQFKKQEKTYSKIVGVTFEGRQEFIKTLKAGDNLILKREPENKFDKNAIQILKKIEEIPATHTIRYKQIGYINKELAEDLADAMDRGNEYSCKITSITGGNEDNSLGVNIEITKMEA